jgi:hypothetical protein
MLRSPIALQRDAQSTSCDAATAHGNRYSNVNHVRSMLEVRAEGQEGNSCVGNVAVSKRMSVAHLGGWQGPTEAAPATAIQLSAHTRQQSLVCCNALLFAMLRKGAIEHGYWATVRARTRFCFIQHVRCASVSLRGFRWIGSSTPLPYLVPWIGWWHRFAALGRCCALRCGWRTRGVVGASESVPI